MPTFECTFHRTEYGVIVFEADSFEEAVQAIEAVRNEGESVSELGKVDVRIKGGDEEYGNVEQIHPDPGYPCPHCARTFSSYRALNGHMNHHRPQS